MQFFINFFRVYAQEAENSTGQNFWDFIPIIPVSLLLLFIIAGILFYVFYFKKRTQKPTNFVSNILNQKTVNTPPSISTTLSPKPLSNASVQPMGMETTSSMLPPIPKSSMGKSYAYSPPAQNLLNPEKPTFFRSTKFLVAIFAFLLIAIPTIIYFGVKRQQNITGKAVNYDGNASVSCSGSPGSVISGTRVKKHFGSLAECEKLCCDGSDGVKCGDIYYCGQGSGSESCTIASDATSCTIEGQEHCGVVQVDCPGGGGDIDYDCSGCGGKPSCDVGQVTLSISNSTPNVGDEVTLTLGGTQGSTFLEEVFYPEGIIDCPAFSSGWPKTTTCKIIASGSFTWTHKWNVCAPNNCDIKSDQCIKTLTVTIGGPTPTPTIPVVGQCRDVRVYDAGGNRIVDYTSIKPGQTVRFTVAGTDSGFDRGRFRINGGAWLPSEGTSQTNSQGEFYLDYPIPDDTSLTVKVEAMVHNQSSGWK